MMTQSVMTQAASLFAHASGSVTFKGKQTGNDFSLMLGNSMKTARSISGSSDAQAVPKTSVQTDETKNSIKSDNTASDNVQTKAIQSDKPAKTDTTKGLDQKSADTVSDNAKPAVSDDSKTDQTEDIAGNEELLAQIQTMLQSIGQTVMDQLNLSPEEFNQMLTDQGLSLTDLLQPENLQQFVLANSGKTDVLAFITDENLADTMKQLLQTIQEITDSHKVMLTPDQIKALLEQVKDAPATKTEPCNSEPVISVNEVPAAVNEPDNKSKITPKAEDANEHQDNGISKTSLQTDTLKEASATSEKSGNAMNSGSDSKPDRDMNASNKFQTFVDNLVNASQNLQANFSDEVAKTSSLREIANQIIERIKVSVTSDKTTMELSLNPDSLGKVNLSVQSKGGVLTAHFIVQNQVSKEAIESQLQTLRDTLHEQGVKVEAIEVTVSANAFDQNYSQESANDSQAKESSSGRKINLDDALHMTETSEDDISLNEPTDISGSVINYTA